MNLRSATITTGPRMAGARSLLRANGMREEHFGKPIFAIANSFTQFVPGHAHLHQVGQYAKKIIEQNGCFAMEFNTIAIDDGIAMGHEGMLYSLPSRELIADSVEYMCNAHCADALLCISNCDKITPGMFLAALRLNIPTFFVSGGPMEAGNYKNRKCDLVDVMVAGGISGVSVEDLTELEKSACPSCGSCSGMFTANSMNCLMEVLGFALPGNGTLVATHSMRFDILQKTAEKLVEITFDYYRNNNTKVLPLSIATKNAFENAMCVDIAMGGSTNSVLHLLAFASEAGVDFTLKDIDRISRNVPCLCKISPNSSYHIEDLHAAGGMAALLRELSGHPFIDVHHLRADGLTVREMISLYDLEKNEEKALQLYSCKPCSYPLYEFGMQNVRKNDFDCDRKKGVVRKLEYAYEKEGGLAVLYGNIAERGALVKTAGVHETFYFFKGKAKVFHSQQQACDAILNDIIQPGDVVVILYEGPCGGPGMQEMLYPTSYLKSKGLDKVCALITDGRFSGGTSGLSIGHISPEAARKGTVALIQNGDEIEIDIRKRRLRLCVSAQVLADRMTIEEKKGTNAFKPDRYRSLSKSLLLYARFAGSADQGAVRTIEIN